MQESELVKHAREYAELAHAGQFLRDVQKSPKIVHPKEVVDLVVASGGKEVEIVSAWLHDVVEDTPTTIEDIKKEFGAEVAEIVFGLTDFPELEKLPLELRKAKQADRVAGESASVRRVKLADQASNVRLIGIEGRIDMSIAERLTYVVGAKKIADNCKGVSAWLDTIFLERYETAFVKLTASEKKDFDCF